MSPLSQDLENSVALVTGASSGIGEATAKALAARGASVALAARRGDRLESLGGEIADAGGTALPIEADVSDREQAEGAVARTVGELGRLDILVNNAGVMLLGPVVDAPVEEWERMVQVNLLGLLYTAHAALPHLLEAAADGPRRVADLVNISSVAGRQARKGSGVYNATKHGVGAFSESLRQEVTGRHLRVLTGRAGGGCHRAAEPQPARGTRPDRKTLRRHGHPPGRGRRRCDRLRGDAPAPCRDQRGPRAPDPARAISVALFRTSGLEKRLSCSAGRRRRRRG